MHQPIITEESPVPAQAIAIPAAVCKVHEYEWQNYKIAEYVIVEGEAPEGWSKYQSVVSVQIQAGNQVVPYGEPVMIPAESPLLALRWLADNIERVAREIAQRGQQQIMAAQRRIVPPRSRFNN